MNLKALITTLVLGTSSIAMASPTVEVHASANVRWRTGHEGRPVVVDHRRPAPVVVDDNCDTPVYQAPSLPAPPIAQPVYFNPNNTTLGGDSSAYVGGKPYLYQRRDFRRWIALTEPTRIDRGREFFKIGAEAGQFAKLRLFNNRGSSFIEQVVIEFADGGAQKIVLGSWLTQSNAMTLDLTGGYRSISRIIVYGSTNRGSAYQILGL